MIDFFSFLVGTSIYLVIEWVSLKIMSINETHPSRKFYMLSRVSWFMFWWCVDFSFECRSKTKSKKNNLYIFSKWSADKKYWMIFSLLLFFGLFLDKFSFAVCDLFFHFLFADRCQLESNKNSLYNMHIENPDALRNWLTPVLEPL